MPVSFNEYEKPMSRWSDIVQLCSYSETLRRKLQPDGLHAHERRRIEVFVALKWGLKARCPSHLSLELGCGAKNRRLRSSRLGEIEKRESFLGNVSRMAKQIQRDLSVIDEHRDAQPF